jgi:hypothetical protein
MVTLKASKLSLNEVHQLLHYSEQISEATFGDRLSLLPLTANEQQQLQEIRENFRAYLQLDRVSEGQVKALTTFPLLQLAGFYRHPIQINIEEGIDEIAIADEAKTITGRFDIVAIHKTSLTPDNVPFWILVIESKESGIEVRQGLPQLLTYAYNSLQHQPIVWWLVTNGLQYLFVYLQQTNSPTYELMPMLDLMYAEPAQQIVKVLKAIGQLD